MMVVCDLCDMLSQTHLHAGCIALAPHLLAEVRQSASPPAALSSKCTAAILARAQTGKQSQPSEWQQGQWGSC